MSRGGAPPVSPADLARDLADAGVRSLHVETDARGASVVVGVEGPEVQATCTCGAPSPCAHTRAALQALGLGPTLAATGGESPASEPGGARRDTRAACARVCATAVATGLEASSPELAEALAALAQALGADHRPDARRAFGRLSDGLAQGKLRKAAQSLVELATVAVATGQPERRSEVTLLEVGRDTGTDALGRWDETILVDLARGDLLLEGAPVVHGREPQMSVGPFPRHLFGQLVDVELGRRPRRVRLIEYEPRGVPTHGDVDRLVGHALPDLEAVRAEAAAGIALVFARVARLGTVGGEPAVVDEHGHALRLAHGARGLTAALLRLVRRGGLRAVLGRVGIAEPEGLEIRPLAAVVGHRVVRLA